MFVVAGVSGNTGRVVAETLLAKGKRVRVFVRDAQKGTVWKAKGAEVAVGTLDDATSLARALEGAQGAYLLLPPDLTSLDPWGRAQRFVAQMADALRKAPVPHVVFLSSVAAHVPSGTGPIVAVRHAEQVLGALPNVRFTFVRAAYFMENVLANLSVMKEQGILPVFGGGETHPFPLVATQDIGEVAARALLEPPPATQVLELAGPKEQSMADVAQAFGKVLGRAVTPHVLPLEAMVPTLTGFGISTAVASQFKEMTEAMGKGLFGWEGGKAVAVRGKVTLDAFAAGVVKG